MTRGILSLGVAVLVALLAVGCSEHEAEDESDHSFSGPSGVAPAPTPTPTPAASPTPTSTSVAYVPEIQPILQVDCTRCHRGFDTYTGTMSYVRPGDAGSPLVAATQPGGSMHSYLSGNAPEKADLIRRWVVDNGAAESR